MTGDRALAKGVHVGAEKRAQPAQPRLLQPTQPRHSTAQQPTTTARSPRHAHLLLVQHVGAQAVAHAAHLLACKGSGARSKG